MRARFNQSFKIQAVEKALNRTDGVGLKDIAESLGIGQSTLGKWVNKSKLQQFEPTLNSEPLSATAMTKEKRPQDWNLEERLQLVIACGSLSDDAINTLCREQGIYPHHVKQWKADFASGQPEQSSVNTRAEIKNFKHEIKILKKELNRKDKALAETAALLVLQKKVKAIWGSDEEDSQ